MKQIKTNKTNLDYQQFDDTSEQEVYIFGLTLKVHYYLQPIVISCIGALQIISTSIYE